MASGALRGVEAEEEKSLPTNRSKKIPGSSDRAWIMNAQQCHFWQLGECTAASDKTTTKGRPRTIPIPNPILGSQLTSAVVVESVE
ncbi:hypothetical protein ACLKA7_015753 [Drosophila subpalustris]